MKPRSAKSKGRKFEQDIVDKLRESFSLDEDDIRRQPASMNGMDIELLSKKARETWAFATECKKQESISIWKCLEQAESNSTDCLAPLLVFSRNRSKTYACLEFNQLVEIVKKLTLLERYWTSTEDQSNDSSETKQQQCQDDS